MCVEEGDSVKEGENILKYTNGTYLTAPYNLVITKLNVPDCGSLCTSKHSITVNGIDTLETTLTVSEDNLKNIYGGQEAQISISALDNKIYTGYVTSVSNTATYSSNGSKFTVKVEFENDGEILIGMTGKTEIILQKVENAVVVPVEAVEIQNKKSYVTLIDNDGNTKQVEVETGISNEAYIEIKSGVEVGETIIIKENTSSEISNKSSFNK